MSRSGPTCTCFAQATRSASSPTSPTAPTTRVTRRRGRSGRRSRPAGPRCDGAHRSSGRVACGQAHSSSPSRERGRVARGRKRQRWHHTPPGVGGTDHAADARASSPAPGGLTGKEEEGRDEETATARDRSRTPGGARLRDECRRRDIVGRARQWGRDELRAVRRRQGRGGEQEALAREHRLRQPAGWSDRDRRERDERRRARGQVGQRRRRRHRRAPDQARHVLHRLIRGGGGRRAAGSLATKGFP